MAIANKWIWFALALGACGQRALPGLGAVKPEALCSEVKRCDVRGDAAISLLKGRKPAPIHLASGQGPESYLGKVAPARKAESVLKTCGGDITRDDWLETSPAVRSVELSDGGKQQLRAALKTHLAQELLRHPEALQGQDASIDVAVEAASLGLGLQKVGLLSQTYWLKDSAFERRVGQCGEEEYENIIYSMTLLRLSDLTQKELESRLLAGLAAKLIPKPVPVVDAAAAADTDESVEAPDPPDPQPDAAGEASAPASAPSPDPRHALLQQLSQGAVRSLANELRMIAAFGFDEK